MKREIGNLDRLERVVKFLRFLTSAPDFGQQQQAMNGASDLWEQIIVERGRHARSAIGTSELPSNIPVEIEVIVQLKD